MLYPLFEMNHSALLPMRFMANAGLAFWQHDANPLAATSFGRSTAASLSMFERATRRYDKPSFEISHTMMNGKSIAVSENIVWQTPFCNLINFAKAGQKKAQTKLLLVAPMSGHFATLLRGTVEEMLPHYDV